MNPSYDSLNNDERLAKLKGMVVQKFLTKKYK